MEWASKLRSTLKGDVPADDIAAGLAASRPLDDLRQRLDDRALEQNLAYPRLPWVPVDALGTLTTSLWLADVVVALVGRVYDAYQPSGSGVRATVRMNQGVHGHLMALLGLVPPLLQEMSIALADPTYAPAVRLPMSIGLRGAVPGALGYLPVDAAYLRGLLAGALYLQHAVDVAAEAARGVTSAAGAPEWMRQVVGQIDKRVAAHAIIVESLQARCAPLLARRALSDDTLFDTTVACWSTISSYVEWGQVLVYPRLGMRAASITSSSPPPGAPLPPVSAWPPVPPPSAGQTGPPAAPTSSPRPPSRPTASSGMPALPGSPASPSLAPVPSAQPQDAPGAVGGQSGQSGTGATAPSRPRPVSPGTTPPGQATGAAAPTPRTVGPRRTTAGTAGPDATPAAGSGSIAREGGGPTLPGAPSSSARATPAASHATPPLTTPTANPSSDAAQAARVTAAPPSPAPPRPRRAARTVGPTERWLLTAPDVRQRLRQDGREEIAATGLDSFWAARRWTVFQDERDYLEAVTRLGEQGVIEQTDAFRGIAPFASVYRVVAGKPTIDGVPLRLGQTFTYDHDQGRVLPR